MKSVSLRNLPRSIVRLNPALKRVASTPKPDATAFFVEAGLPEPVLEYRFHAVRKWRLDYAWPVHRVALEVEGAVWTNGRHTRGSGFVKDMEKYNHLAKAGYRLLRVQPKDLCTFATVEMLAQALEVRLPE